MKLNMKLGDYIDLDLLDKMVNEKYVNIKHDSIFPIAILNYTKSCQSDGIWNDVTMKCRGIVVDTETQEILARPFTKFFNYEELENMDEEIPNRPYTITEKMDGSLGILYWYNDKAYITTKGSLNSTQGQFATELLNTKYAHVLPLLDRSKTYLFEIIWSKDHQCISYGDTDDLYLIGIIDIESGEESNPQEMAACFPVPQEYPSNMNWKYIRTIIDGDNKEGYVVKFDNNFRMKLKYESYWRIHFARTNITPKHILESLMNNDNIDDIRNLLDEENRITFDTIVNRIRAEFTDIQCKVYNYFEDCPGPYGDFLTMETVNYCKSFNYPYTALLFTAAHHGTPVCKEVMDGIWNVIKKNLKDIF